MPAVTVSDITVLPRVSELPGARARKVKSITTAPQGFEGEGFTRQRSVTTHTLTAQVTLTTSKT